MFVLSGAAVAVAVPAAGQNAVAVDPPLTGPRGPVEIRDEHLLAQPRLTLPPLSPTLLPPGRWDIQVSFLTSNSFSWTQDAVGETPNDRRFLVDGEAHTLALQVRRGLSARLDVGLRVPLRSRGGGALDAFIDHFHRALSLPDGERPQFVRGAFRVEARTPQRARLSWTDRSGGGLGNVEAEARFQLRPAAQGTTVAFVARAAFPTATGPFAEHGPGAGAQLVATSPLGPSLDLTVGAGATVQGPGPVGGIEYVPGRAHGFVALEWRPWRRISLLAETDAASRLVRNIDRYPGVHWMVNLTGRMDLGHRLRLDLGLTENLIDQQSTTDLALFVALGIRP